MGFEKTMSIKDGYDMYMLHHNYKDRLKTPEGRIVEYTGKNGYDIQHKHTPFKIGTQLTVHEIYVGRSSSTVEFKEFPNMEFNTVMFKDVN